MKGESVLSKNKIKALELLQKKNNRELTITYEAISYETGYSRMQLSRFAKALKNKSIPELLIHGNKGKKPFIAATAKELSYIREFKKKYPSISITQFQDIYNEDIITNPKMQNIIREFNLKKRSVSFFQQLYKKENWISPIKHKSFYEESNIHPLRVPTKKRGILIMLDATPYDWLRSGKKFSLHLAIDDATGEILAGFFLPKESELGYCHLMKIIIEKEGIPASIYTDKRILKKEKGSTQFERMMNELGIRIFLASSKEAKGKIEKWNSTIQGRLSNDIIRFNIKTYHELNNWFNTFYCKYLNAKFAHQNACIKSAFNNNYHLSLANIFCIKKKKKILNGNMISVNNNYYIPINEFNEILVFYKGTIVESWQDISNQNVRIFKNNKIYNTKKVRGH